MATFNRMHGELTCPRCGIISSGPIQLHFGDTSRMVELTIGAIVPVARHRLRELAKSYTGCGYTECAHCQRDFYVRAVVQGGRLASVSADRRRLPVSADASLPANFACPVCEQEGTAEVELFEGYDLGRYHCFSRGSEAAACIVGYVQLAEPFVAGHARVAFTLPILSMSHDTIDNFE